MLKSDDPLLKIKPNDQTPKFFLWKKILFELRTFMCVCVCDRFFFFNSLKIFLLKLTNFSSENCGQLNL